MGKHIFVLHDEVILSAQTGLNQMNQPDASALELLQLILKNCHGIALSWQQWKVYLRTLDKLYLQAVEMVPANIAICLDRIKRDSGKDNREIADEDLEGVDGLDTAQLTQHQRGKLQQVEQYLRVARAASGILVLSDDDLKTALEGTDIPAANNFRIALPEEALRWAREL